MWQWIKHLALADYVTPWAAKVGSIARTIFIVDLFAGAGTYRDLLSGLKMDGSPVIFARQALRYSERFRGRELRVICVERNQKNASALQERRIRIARHGTARLLYSPRQHHPLDNRDFPRADPLRPDRAQDDRSGH